MSDTPTTAEEVITEAYQAWVVASLRPGIHDDWPAAVVAALRNSPDALADLNGGEWVQPEDNGGRRAYWNVAGKLDWLAFPVEGATPLFVFVPKEADHA